ncbi:MAG: phenylalanine--tRNA ligase subunit beta [Candidatus Omnitrophica bacterium]|nr:phenylalanine--tRNA ligase subunit beta [Candidatus Omnitrophota bacterium]MCM8827253.1 phenylalanine--tRNA ligase subunit beta [Candidatus Omnitrophota bacterium]
MNINIYPQELSSLLTMAGMEVERLESKGKDWIFEIEVTANRYDWLSIIGIAREISVCLNKKLKLNYPKIKNKPRLKKRKIIIESPQDCLFYIGRLIRGLNITNSPLWLQERVLNCGINSVNNIVDITNYCMLKWGTPLHAFDDDKIEGNVYIRRAKEGEKLITIDGKERELCRDNLVIADDKKVIALAGVMGGKDSEVDENTKNVFLEAAVFSPLTIRRSRQKAGLVTESSYRFERAVFSDYLEYASQEANLLIEELAGGKLIGYGRGGRKPLTKKKVINVSINDLNSYLGANIPKNSIKKILSNLDFQVKEIGSNKLQVVSPAFRFDIKEEVDIYEEVVRIYGYDKIQPHLPFLPFHLNQDELFEFKRKLRSFLSILGMKEIITYSIVSEKDLKNLVKIESINITNPLREQENALRPTLLTGTLDTIMYNLNRNQRNLRFFEIANIYIKDKNNFKEIPTLSLGVSGIREEFFFLKGIVEELLNYLNIIQYEFKEDSLPNFLQALRVVIEKEPVGFLGKLDEKVRKELDLKENIFYGEFNLELLQKLRKENKYKTFSQYPIVYRDISLGLRKDISFKKIGETIREVGKEFLYNYKVIDIYRGKDLSQDSNFFTLRIFYQSKERTLTSEEVDTIHQNIREELSKKEDIIVR